MTSLGALVLDDDITARLYTHSARQVRVFVLAIAAILAVQGVLIWLWVVAPDLARTHLYAGLAIVVFVMAWPLWPPAAVSRPTWRLVSRRLLAEQPWREAAVRVLNISGTVLALPGGEYVRVHDLPVAAREVVVRVGRVWLVGPDARGKMAVRVDGLHTAWPARRLPPQRGTAALPFGGPIAAMWVLALARPVVPVTFSVYALIAVLQLPLNVSPELNWWSLGWACVILGVTAVGWSRYWRVRRLRHAGPWTRVEATAPSWRVRRNGLADGTVTLGLPDGRRVTARLDRAPLDLFANVRREGALWVADNNVVGFPHYPIVAAARLPPVSPAVSLRGGADPVVERA